MKKKLFVIVVMLLCATLVIAQEPVLDHQTYMPIVLRPLQVTKTTQALAFSPEPNEGTFRIRYTTCWTQGELAPKGECYVYLKNDADALLIVDRVSITTGDPRVDELQLVTTLPMALNALGYGSFTYRYSLHENAAPGTVLFDIEVTCVGY